MKKRKTIMEISIESQLLIDRLEKAEINEIIPYKELSEIVCRDIQTMARGNLETAKRNLMRDKSMVFDTIWDIGIKRVNDTAIVEGGKIGLQRARRQCDKVKKRLTCADYDELSRKKQVEHNTTFTMACIGKRLLSPLGQKKLAIVVRKTRGVLPLQKALKAFKDMG